jgi:predicted ABC-type ATPase
MPENAAMAAGRIMLEQIAAKIASRSSFAFETTLAGRSYSVHIPLWRKAGFHVKLIFLGLPSADLAVARVQMRVAQGGHSVPEDVVRRRFELGLKNFRHLYRKIVDEWVLYDNVGQPRVLSNGRNR